jgi:hypothetical protein
VGAEAAAATLFSSLAVAAPAAGGAAAVAALTGALVLTAIAFMAVYALSKFYDSTLGLGLRRLAATIDNAIPGPWDIGEATLGRMDDAIMGGFGRVLSALSAATTRVFAGLAWTVETIWDAMADLGAATLQAVVGITNGEIPTQIARRMAANVRRITSLERTVRVEIRKAVASFARRAQALEADLDRTFGAARRGIDFIRDVSLPRIQRRVTDAVQGINSLRRYVFGRVNARLTRLERLTIGAALTAGVLGVLTKYFPWWRCTATRRFMRGLCRAPLGALDNLLSLLLAFTVSYSVVEFAEAMQDLTVPFTEVVHYALHDPSERG